VEKWIYDHFKPYFPENKSYKFLVQKGYTLALVFNFSIFCHILPATPQGDTRLFCTFVQTVLATPNLKTLHKAVNFAPELTLSSSRIYKSLNKNCFNRILSDTVTEYLRKASEYQK
jgi:hypothetical protein